MSFAYACLGYDSFRNLPGTETEIKKIGSIFNHGRLITGNEATEENLIRLAQNGDLAKAGILHFAVHGIAMPGYPELSALVLSRNSGAGSREGYLNAAEIGRMKIDASFVNLSACETGLGKLVRGEGVVGLTHAFFPRGPKACRFPYGM